ncbi:hypothetical protein Drorol1_Dr00010121 [Drosera rotundifolia]
MQDRLTQTPPPPHSLLTSSAPIYCLCRLVFAWTPPLPSPIASTPYFLPVQGMRNHRITKPGREKELVMSVDDEILRAVDVGSGEMMKASEGNVWWKRGLRFSESSSSGFGNWVTWPYQSMRGELV